MARVNELYVDGYAKPLGQWTDAALSQLSADVKAVLATHPSTRARTELYETLFVVEAEQKRREQAPEREAIALPQKRPTLSLFRRTPQQSAARETPAAERSAAEASRADEIERSGAEAKNDGLGL
ncbi:MAG: hypothetical protein R3C52_04195 [Hyphomonadaceae bacterium]